jgi:hypothetical protein
MQRTLTFISALEPIAPCSQDETDVCFQHPQHLNILNIRTLLFVYRKCAQASIDMNQISLVYTYTTSSSICEPALHQYLTKRINCTVLTPQC